MRSESLRLLRLRARLPRMLACAALAFLALAGLRTAVEGTPEAAPPAPPGTGDLGARGFAEAFARVYLSWDAARPDERERAVSAYMSTRAAEQGVAVLPGRGSETVSWTAAVAERARPGGRTVVTVAAATSSGLVHLAVPVGRDARGFLRIDAQPAIVGPPPTTRAGGLAPEQEVEDARLAAVVVRALRNYLGRERQNLLADLAPDAVVSVPSEPLRVESVEQPVWVVARERVALALEAQRPDGLRLPLRYELDVVRSDRWYVRSIGADPTNRGGSG